MRTKYHAEITKAALEDVFSAADLEVIVQANLRQDRIAGQIGHPEYHFDDNAFEASLAYIEEQRQLVLASIMDRGKRSAALEAFGRLLHTRQDFYAHSNWVRLWVDRCGGIEQDSANLPGAGGARSETIGRASRLLLVDPTELCHDPLGVPELRSGESSVGLLLLYMLPVVGKLVGRVFLPPTSHEAMNLDHPGRGPLFHYAVAAAIEHSKLELQQTLEEIETAAGESAVHFFLRG